MQHIPPQFPAISGSNLKILIIHTRWNAEIVQSLVDAACYTLVSKHNVPDENVEVLAVGGSYELPQAANIKIKQGKYDAVICIGVLIKGKTMHFEYIAQAVSSGIMQVSLETGVPVVFGVLTCLNTEQAWERAGRGGANFGSEWASTAVEMASL